MHVDLSDSINASPSPTANAKYFHIVRFFLKIALLFLFTFNLICFLFYGCVSVFWFVCVYVCIICERGIQVVAFIV